ncbi:hypothetical protein SASPL_149473 [Salvia splendens]|uniref:Uncharacterized protein n=1 Tax=Salvia splendens TaxID=180675 RepID=A0A8X8WBS6_SALSN|nr:hypothetical protein SASPL_149473 [Salvia splendens]
MTRRGDGQSGLSMSDNSEGSNPPRAFQGSSEILSTGLEKIMARFDKLESRLESRCEEIDLRVKNLHASKAAYRLQSSADFDSGAPRRRPTGWAPPFETSKKMEEFDQVSEKTEEYDQASVKTEDFEQESNFSSPFYFKLLNPSFSFNQESSLEMEKIVSLEGVCGEKEEEDFRAEGKMVDEEFCYEIELIPDSHSSSLDRESDAH